MTPLKELPGDTASAPNAINERGQVVGFSALCTEFECAYHAVLWEHGNVINLGTLGGTSSGANAINNRGQVVGGSDTATGESHAYLWQHGKMIDLGTLPGGTSSAAIAINNSGQILGNSITADGSQHAVIWIKRHSHWDDDRDHDDCDD
jgi:probable HAF family extracellular repeat protein